MKRDKKADAEISAALAELDGVRLRMEAVRSEFRRCADPLLVEANIHELNALNARYGYLLRQLKNAQPQAAEVRGRGKGRKKA